MNKEKMVKEAIKRMGILHVMDNVADEFETNGTVYVSERQNAMFSAVLYWASNYPHLEDEIRKFEEKYNALVYHVQLTRMAFGDCFAFLYVSDSEDEWEEEKNGLAMGEAMSYVWNASDPILSEFGFIGVKPEMGGIVRTW